MTIKEAIRRAVEEGVTLEEYVREYMKTEMKLNILILPENTISQLVEEEHPSKIKEYETRQ